jgi:hypothetical protein
MGDGMRKVASLTVAVAVSLAATSQLALGGDKRPKQSGNASCMQLTYGCLTCADGPLTQQPNHIQCRLGYCRRSRGKFAKTQSRGKQALTCCRRSAAPPVVAPIACICSLQDHNGGAGGGRGEKPADAAPGLELGL